ncbi:MAG: META domain-containing protein [Sphingomonadales bacterium]|nr:META domain-containing protein [Sphingomonadales bacterium]MBD3774470.1 META domain-containing protein [Paracoccaceae bacterium]
MRRLVPILTALLLVGACAPKELDDNPLQASEWRFITIDSQPPASPDKARLGFQDGRIGANVGCNAMGGPWRIEQGRLIAGPLVTTEMYCAGPVWDQEMAVSALLAATPEIALDDDLLVLRSPGHSAELERISPRQPAP